jgi:hypothetical protein
VKIPGNEKKKFEANGRVARFFSIQLTKNGQKCTESLKIYQWPKIFLNCHKIYHIALKYTNIFHSNAIQNFWNFWYANVPSGNPRRCMYVTSQRHSFKNCCSDKNKKLVSEIHSVFLPKKLNHNADHCHTPRQVF